MIDTGVETSPGASGGSRVKNTYDGAELTYDNVDLGSAPLSTLTVRYVVNEGRSGVNASVDIYLDEKTDENKVATAELAPTGNDWEAYGETTVDLLREVSGEHTVILVMHTDPKPGEDEGYPNYVGNIDYLEFGLAPLPETYLTSETPWNYSDNGTDPSGDGSLSWTTAEAGDWQQAAGPFGSKRGEADLGGGFVATTLLQYTLDGSENTVPTYHFRTDVAISEDDLARLEALQGTITYDDAVRVYVNGEKVAGFADDRVNDAENQNLTYAGESAGDPVSRTFEIPADALVAGDNQIAVALYQDRESSSDIFFDWTSLAPVEEGVVVPTEITDLLLGVGETEEQRNLSWYSNTDVPQAAQLAKAADVVDGAFPETAATFETTAGGETTSGEYFRDTTLTGLEENTEYSYRVGSDENGWSEVETFRTQAFDGDFDFLLFGDPQVGASGNLANDEAGWVSTMNTATQTYPGPSCCSPPETRSTPRAARPSTPRSSSRRRCARFPWRPPTATTTWGRRPTSSTTTCRTKTSSRARPAARPPRAATTGSSTRTCCSSTSTRTAAITTRTMRSWRRSLRSRATRSSGRCSASTTRSTRRPATRPTVTSSIAATRCRRRSPSSASTWC